VLLAAISSVGAPRARLALCCYSVVAGKFLAEDFAYSMRLPLAVASSAIGWGVEEGYLAARPWLKLTQAGRLALLGRLAELGGRWWLATDARAVDFMVEEMGLWVAPFTTLLWEEVEDAVELAVVVRGLGAGWMREYASIKPFTALRRAEEGCLELASALRRGLGLAQAVSRLARIWRILREVGANTGVEVGARPRAESWSELLDWCEALLGEVERVRRELVSRLG